MTCPTHCCNIFEQLLKEIEQPSSAHALMFSVAQLKKCDKYRSTKMLRKAVEKDLNYKSKPRDLTRWSRLVDANYRKP
jgi:formate dehydrogenase maturation protein FdhE